MMIFFHLFGKNPLLGYQRINTLDAKL